MATLGFENRGHDGPVQMVRSAQLGVRPTVHLADHRDDMASHVDRMEVFDFQGTTRDDCIGESCLRDVRATAALHRKLEGTLLPLFKGGA